MKVQRATKKSALSRGNIVCVGEVATLNVTRGCAGSCAFCYARCYPGAPDPGTLLVYQDLPGQLRQELDSRRRKRPAPRFVVIGTACDPFLGPPAVLDVTRGCLEVLLGRDIGVSLATRGEIPSDVIGLLSRHAPLVQLTISLASMSEQYTRQWEPGTAAPMRRIFLVQKLREAGIEPWLRIDPIIPFVNDGTPQLGELLSTIVGAGFSRATASFMQLRPGVADQLRREAPVEAQRLVLGSFPAARGDGPRFDHIPVQQALGKLRRLQRLGLEQGLRIAACRCQNPGLPAAQCPVIPRELPAKPRGHQSELFEVGGEESEG